MDMTVNFKEILEQMQKNLECSICLELLNCPISTKCEHLFCRFCILKFLQNKRAVPCPLCKKQITKRGFQERNDLVAVVNNFKLLIAAFEHDTGQKCPQKCCPSNPEELIQKNASYKEQKNEEASNSWCEEKSKQESCHNITSTEKPLDHLTDSTNKEERNVNPKTRYRSGKAKKDDEHSTIKEGRNQSTLELNQENNTDTPKASLNHKKPAKENKEDLLHYLEVGSCGANWDCDASHHRGNIVDADNVKTRSLSKIAQINLEGTICDENNFVKRVRKNPQPKTKHSMSNVKLNKSLACRSSNRLLSRKVSDINPHLDHSVDENVSQTDIQQSETLTQQMGKTVSQQSSHSSEDSSGSSTLQLSKTMPPISWTYTKRMQQMFKAEGRVRNWAETLPKPKLILQCQEEQSLPKTNVTPQCQEEQTFPKTNVTPQCQEEQINLKTNVTPQCQEEQIFLKTNVTPQCQEEQILPKTNVTPQCREEKTLPKSNVKPQTQQVEFKSLTKEKINAKKSNKRSLCPEGNLVAASINGIANGNVFNDILTELDDDLGIRVHPPVTLLTRRKSIFKSRLEDKQENGKITEKNVRINEEADPYKLRGHTPLEARNIAEKGQISEIVSNGNKLDLKQKSTSEGGKSKEVRSVLEKKSASSEQESNERNYQKSDQKEQPEELILPKKRPNRSPVSLIRKTDECESKELMVQENDNIQDSVFEESPEIVQKTAPLEVYENKIDSCQKSGPSNDKKRQNLGHNVLLSKEKKCARDSRSIKSSKDANQHSPSKPAHETNTNKPANHDSPSKLAHETNTNKVSKICQASIKNPSNCAKTRKRAAQHRNKTLKLADWDTLSQRSSNELNNLIQEISQAEDYSFSFSTQDAIKKMEQVQTLYPKDRDNNRVEINTIEDDIVDVPKSTEDDIVDVPKSVDDDKVDVPNLIANNIVDKINPNDDTIDVSNLSSGHDVVFGIEALNMADGSEAKMTPKNVNVSIHCGVVKETPCADELSDSTQQITSAKESGCTDVIGHHQTGPSESVSDKNRNSGHITQNESIPIIPEHSLREQTDRFEPIKNMAELKSQQGVRLYKRPNFKEMIHVSPGQTGMLSFTGSSVPKKKTPMNNRTVLTESESQDVRNKLVFSDENSIIENDSLHATDSVLINVESQPIENRAASSTEDKVIPSNLNASQILSDSTMSVNDCSKPSIIKTSILSNSSETIKKPMDEAYLTLKSKEVCTHESDFITMMSNQGLINENLVLVPDTCIQVDSQRIGADISQAETVIMDSVEMVENRFQGKFLSERSVVVFNSCLEQSGGEDKTNVRVTQAVVSETQSTLSPGRLFVPNKINQESLNVNMVIPAINSQEIVATDGTQRSVAVHENLSESSSPSQSVLKIENQPRNLNFKQDTIKNTSALNCSQSPSVISQSESLTTYLKAKVNGSNNNIHLVEETQQPISQLSTPKPNLMNHCTANHSVSSPSNSSNLKRPLHPNDDLQPYHEQPPSSTSSQSSTAPNPLNRDEDDDVPIVRKSKRRCHSLDNTPLKPVAFNENPKVHDIEDVEIIGETLGMEDLDTNTEKLMNTDTLSCQVIKQDELNIHKRNSKCMENFDKNTNEMLPRACNASIPQDEDHLTQGLLVHTFSNEAKRIRTNFKELEPDNENSFENDKSHIISQVTDNYPETESGKPHTPTCQVLKTKRGLATKSNLQLLESLPKHPRATLTALEKAVLIGDVEKSVTEPESDVEMIDVDKKEIKNVAKQKPGVREKYSRGKPNDSSVTSLKRHKLAGNVKEDLEKKKIEIALFSEAVTGPKYEQATNNESFSETSGVINVSANNPIDDEEEVAVSFDLGVSSFDDKDEEIMDEMEVAGNKDKSAQQKTSSTAQVYSNPRSDSDTEIVGNHSQPDSLPLTSSPLDREDATDILYKFDQSEIQAAEEVDGEIFTVTDDDDDDDCSKIKKRSKRQQISSDSEVSLEGLNEPNGTASSVISSQSETLTTQQQLALEGDLEKLHQEIVKYEAELGKQSLDNMSPDHQSEEDEMSIIRKRNPDIFVVDDSSEEKNKDEEDSDDLFLSPEAVSSPEPQKRPLRALVPKTLTSQSRITEHIMKQFQSPGGSVRTKKHLEFLPSSRPDFNKTNEVNQSKTNNFKAHSKCGALTSQSTKDEMAQNSETKSFNHNDRPGSPIISSQKCNQMPISRITENRCSPNTFESKKICMVASGFGREENLMCIKFCEKFGATLFPTFTKDVTHVIMKPACGYGLVCDRTLKFFQGLAHKCWVLAFSWLAKSLQAGKLLSEIDFEIEGDTSGGLCTNGPKQSRISQGQLFSDFCFACVGNSDEMPKKTLSDLLTVCGAVVVDDPIALISKVAKYKLIVRCSDSDAPPSPVELDMFNGLYKHMKLLTVMREWVLDSLGSYSLLPLAEYVLNTCDLIQVPF